MIEIGIRDVERVFVAIYDVPAARTLAMRARLEHLRKKGCPRGLATGRGKVALFETNQLLELATALALIDVGISPDHAVGIMKSYADLFLKGYAALGRLGLAKSEWFAAVLHGEWKASSTVIATCSTQLLSDGLVAEIHEVHEDYRPMDARMPTAAVVLDLGSIWAQTVFSASRIAGTNPTDVAGLFFSAGAGHG